MKSKIQLLLIYFTAVCLFVALGLLYHIHLVWLALPFALIIVHSSITMWFPSEQWFEQINEDEIIKSDDDSSILILTSTEGKPNDPSFENYQHIKKALASHQAQFPHARIHHPSPEIHKG